MVVLCDIVRDTRYVEYNIMFSAYEKAQSEAQEIEEEVHR